MGDLIKKRAYAKTWYAANRLKHCKRNRADSRTLTARFRQLTQGAKIRKLLVSICFDEYRVLVSQPCFYCNGVLPETGHGIDRINSDIGYVQGNCRPCCTQYNKAKNDYTETEFKEWALRLFNNWAGK